MFSKQLEYSYLMYVVLKETSRSYLSSEEIIEATNVPKRWGRALLSKMVSKNIIASSKGKGFSFVEKELSFWEFYVLVEENTLKNEKIILQKIDDINIENYRNILLKIGLTVQEEMKNIKI